MKAVYVTRYGGPDVLAYRADAPMPEPGAGEILLEIAYCGVNFHDVYVRTGLYRHSRTYANQPPMIIGTEAAGRVAKLGAGVEGLKVGDRVAYALHYGSYGQFMALPAWKAVRVPDDVPMDVAAALMVQGCTAHYLTHSCAPLSPGMSCVVHAGAGGVGQLLIQLAKARGATVHATVGSPEKAEIARARGADHAILYREVDFAEEVLRLTDGIGVNVVYDSVGKTTLDGSFRALARRGVLVNYGNSSGAVAAIDPLDVAEAGSVFYTRPHQADYMTTNAERQQRADDLFGMFRDDKLTVTIDRILPLAEAAEAHRVLEARETKGKLLLTMA